MILFVYLDNSGSDSSNDHLSVHLQQLGERLYPKVSTYNTMTNSILYKIYICLSRFIQ